MKIRRNFIYLLFSVVAVGQTPQPQPAVLPEGRVFTLTIGVEPITVLHVRPSYVSSVRLPEDVSSVVIGDPKSFATEHSEAEPRLVFLRPLTTKPIETNVLITTKAGHEISLHVISDGKAAGGQVDFLIEYQRPHSFLVPETEQMMTVGETREVGTIAPPQPSRTIKQIATALDPQWQGKELQVAVGATVKSGEQMTVAFAIKNNSHSPIELLPPQIQLSATSHQRHAGKTKAEQMAISQYQLTTRDLLPGQIAEGIVVFTRPMFKETEEQLLLQIARADQVDRPVLIPIAFTAQQERSGL